MRLWGVSRGIFYDHCHHIHVYTYFHTLRCRIGRLVFACVCMYVCVWRSRCLGGGVFVLEQLLAMIDNRWQESLHANAKYRGMPWTLQLRQVSGLD